VLDILKLFFWAPTQHQNKPLLELKGYRQRSSKHFSGPVKMRALKKETAKTTSRALLRGQNRAGLGGKSTPCLASQRTE